MSISLDIGTSEVKLVELDTLNDGAVLAKIHCKSTWNDLELGDYTERYLVDQFSSVKNVGRIRTGGLRELSIRVWIDPIKLAANNLTIQEVEICLLYSSDAADE